MRVTYPLDWNQNRQPGATVQNPATLPASLAIRVMMPQCLRLKPSVGRCRTQLTLGKAMASSGHFAFARRLGYGKWYTYAEFYHYYSGCGAILKGDEGRTKALRRKLQVARQMQRTPKNTRGETWKFHIEANDISGQLAKHKNEVLGAHTARNLALGSSTWPH